MGTLQRSNWKAWNPNGDELNSSPLGLLRADNITFIEDGVAKLARGTTRRSTGAFANVVNGIYSSDILAASLGLTGAKKKVRYVSYNGNVVRNYCAPNFLEDEFSGGFLSGGDTQSSAFATAWGHNFAFSGTQKRADKGLAASWRDVGIPAPLTPGVAQNTPPENPVIGSFPLIDWTTVEQQTSSLGPDYYTLQVNNTTLRGILQSQTYGGTATWDTTDFTATGQNTPNDIFQVPIRFSDSSKIVKLRCELLLDSPQIPSATQDVTDFFWFEWYSNDAVNTNPSYLDPDVFNFSDRQAFIDRVREQLEPGIALETFFREGTNFWGNIQARRYQFKRSGVDATKDWTTVKAFRFIITATDVLDMWIGEDIKFIGGVTGPLSDWFSYKQVNINNTGEYVEVGLPSPASSDIQVFQSSIRVTPAAAPGNANKIRIYRASTHTPGYYLVKEGDAPLAAFDDTYSDIDALRDGIQLEDYRTALPNGILTAIGPYYDRLLYFDLDTMYVSYQYDPGSYDSRHSFQITGSENEYILWAKVVIDGVILVGTTKDIYQVSGNLAYDETTGLLDVTIVGFKIEQPPVSSACAIHSNVLYYLAEDGWRSIAGSASNSIVGSIDLLFRNQTRHGIGYVNVGANGISSCCVSKNRLITSMDFSDLGRGVLVYDFIRQSWEFWHNDVNFTNNPLVLYSESDGTVLFGTTDTGDRYLYEWDAGDTLGEGTNQALRLRTIYDADGKPDNRKEALTLKIQCDTGGNALTLTVRTLTDGASGITISESLNCTGAEVKFFDISSLGKNKRFQIEIDGFTNLFKLYNFSIEYIALPTQVNYLVLKPSNLGTAGRKRIPVIPMVIDTLGNDVTFQSVIDGSFDSATLINTTDKKTYNHYFTDDTIGTDVGGILSCSTGVFEFYDLIQPREVEVLPDPLQFKWIPYNNYGVAAKKRIRTLPYVIDTKGQNVVFTPKVDGVAYPTSTFNTDGKRTVLHYFTSDVFGIDFGGSLAGSSNFEYYAALQPENVETLPVGKKWDQLGPLEFNRQARLRAIRYRVLPEGTLLSFRFFAEDDQIFAKTVSVTANKEQTVEVSLPKGVTATVLRVEISSAYIFHRFKGDFKIDITGSGTDWKWMPVK